LILLALGFLHPVLDGLISESGVELDSRKNVKVDNNQATNLQKVFAAGDSVSGASLVVNAIASGRKAAKEISRKVNPIKLTKIFFTKFNSFHKYRLHSTYLIIMKTL